MLTPQSPNLAAAKLVVRHHDSKASDCSAENRDDPQDIAGRLLQRKRYHEKEEHRDNDRNSSGGASSPTSPGVNNLRRGLRSSSRINSLRGANAARYALRDHATTTTTTTTTACSDLNTGGNNSENHPQPKKQKTASGLKSCQCDKADCPYCSPSYDSLSDTDDGSSDYEEQSKKKTASSTSSRAKVVLYRGSNHCGASIHGPGGLFASNAAKAPAMMAAKPSSESSDTTAEAVDLFDGSTFKTSSSTRVPESLVMGLMKEDNKMELQRFIFKHGGSIIHHPIDGSPEHHALVSIVYHSAQNGDIQALSCKSQSANDPKTNRSCLELVGALQTIVSKYPVGYDPCSSARGEDVVKGLRKAVAANCEAVGAFPKKGKLFGHNWTKAVPSTKVGGKGTKGGLLMGGHPDQNKANDPLFYTARNCIATITPFNIDFILYVVYLNDKGTKTRRQVGVITQTLPANTSYYLPHRLSGRAAIAQVEFKGKQSLLLVEHRVYFKEEGLQSHRSVLIKDFVFPTKELHDEFLKKVDPNNESYQLPSKFNNLESLFKELAKADPSLKRYVKGGKLFENVSNTIKNHHPHANQFNLLCSGSKCSNTASALDLREDEEEYGGRSGEDLLLHIQSIYKKSDLLAGGRLLCLDCTSDIPDDQVLRNLCFRCLVRPRLSNLASCESCGDYHCSGYLLDGTTMYECEPGGVKLLETNVASGRHAICNTCKNTNARARYTRKSDASKDAENEEIMRAMYELNDEAWQKKEEIKEFLRGKQTIQVSWKKALHAEDGYGPLKGKTMQETQRKYQKFVFGAGIGIKSVAEFDDYINNGGKVGIANRGHQQRT
eukprot:scaffold1811_cov137-Skeletonema_marinoi.AAC.11